MVSVRHGFDGFLFACALAACWPITSAVAEDPEYSLQEEVIRLLERQDFRSALPIIQNKLERYETKGVNSINYASDLSTAAKICAVLGENPKAEQYHTKRLQVLDLCVGCESTKYMEAVRDFATFYAHTHEDDKALSLLNDYVEAVKEVAGSETREHATATLAMADYLYSQNRYQEAYAAYSYAVSIFRETETEEDQTPTLSALNNLASCCKRLNNYKTAERIYNEVLHVLDTAPKDAIHPLGAAATLGNIGVFYEDYNDFPSAERVLMRALNLAEVHAGKKSDIYINSLTKLAIVLCRKGDAAAALPLLQEAVSLHLELRGDESLAYAIALDNLAAAHNSLKEHEKALEFVARSANIIRKTAGEKSIDYAILLDNWACMLCETKKYSEAEHKSKLAMGILEELLGENHPTVAVCWSNYASFLCPLGQLEEAVFYKEKALTAWELLRAQTTSEHYRVTFMDGTAFIYEQTAAIYHKLGLDEKAYETAERRRAKSLLELLASRLYTGKRYDNSRIGEIETEIEKIRHQQQEQASNGKARGICVFRRFRPVVPKEGARVFRVIAATCSE